MRTTCLAPVWETSLSRSHPHSHTQTHEVPLDRRRRQAADINPPESSRYWSHASKRKMPSKKSQPTLRPKIDVIVASKLDYASAAYSGRHQKTHRLLNPCRKAPRRPRRGSYEVYVQSHPSCRQRLDLGALLRVNATYGPSRLQGLDGRVRREDGVAGQATDTSGTAAHGVAGRL